LNCDNVILAIHVYLLSVWYYIYSGANTGTWDTF